MRIVLSVSNVPHRLVRALVYPRQMSHPLAIRESPTNITDLSFIKFGRLLDSFWPRLERLFMRPPTRYSLPITNGRHLNAKLLTPIFDSILRRNSIFFGEHPNRLFPYPRLQFVF